MILSRVQKRKKLNQDKGDSGQEVMCLDANPQLVSTDPWGHMNSLRTGSFWPPHRTSSWRAVIRRPTNVTSTICSHFCIFLLRLAISTDLDKALLSASFHEGNRRQRITRRLRKSCGTKRQGTTSGIRQ